MVSILMNFLGICKTDAFVIFVKKEKPQDKHLKVFVQMNQAEWERRGYLGLIRFSDDGIFDLFYKIFLKYYKHGLLKLFSKKRTQ